MLRELEYESGLSIEEASERYDEVRSVFDGVKGRYERGLLGRIGVMRKGDRSLLADCVGNLLVLSHEAPVVEQTYLSRAREEGLSYEDTLSCRAARLLFQITNYLADFRNTGIKRIG